MNPRDSFGSTFSYFLALLLTQTQPVTFHIVSCGSSSVSIFYPSLLLFMLYYIIHFSLCLLQALNFQAFSFLCTFLTKVLSLAGVKKQLQKNKKEKKSVHHKRLVHFRALYKFHLFPRYSLLSNQHFLTFIPVENHRAYITSTSLLKVVVFLSRISREICPDQLSEGTQLVYHFAL